MGTRIGLLSSNKGAVVLSPRSSKEDIIEALSRYSQRDLFEFMLMLEYLLLKTKRKEHASHIWIHRLDRHLYVISSKVLQETRVRFMKKLGLRNAFDANQ